MTQSDRYKKRDCVERYWAFKDEVLAEMRGTVIPPSIEIAFALPMPKSWSKKKRSIMDGTPHQQKPDFDNLLKAFTDAILHEDCQIWAGTHLKVWREQGAILWRPYDATEQLNSINAALDAIRGAK